MIIDWLPFYLTLLAYDFLRGFVDKHPLFDPYFLPQIRVDEILFGGSLPTVMLQQRLFDLRRLPWYDVPTWAVYLTHFFLIFVVAVILWRVARPGSSSSERWCSRSASRPSYLCARPRRTALDGKR